MALSKETVKLKASELTEWSKGYVYQADIFKDLMEHAIVNYTSMITIRHLVKIIDRVTEYLLESEHAGIVASCGEISTDAWDDVAELLRKRKVLLTTDYEMYCDAEG